MELIILDNLKNKLNELTKKFKKPKSVDDEFEIHLDEESLDVEENEEVRESFQDEAVENNFVDEADEDDNKTLSFLKGQLPFLYNIVVQIIEKLKPKKVLDVVDNELDEDLGQDDDSDNKIKPKRKISLIQAIIILGILFLALDHFFPSDVSDKTKELKTKKQSIKNPVKTNEKELLKKEKKKKTILYPNKVDQQKNNKDPDDLDELFADEDLVDDLDKSLSEKTTDPVEVKNEEIKIETTDPVEAKNEEIKIETTDPVEAKNEEIKIETTDPVEAKNEEIEIETTDPVEVKDDEINTENIEVDKLNTEEADDTLEASDVPNPLDELNNEDLFDDGIVDEVIDSTGSPDITNSILQKLEKEIQLKKKAQVINKTIKATNPPEYDSSGRGLVYNCKGKHWACIDSKRFRVCGENFSWNSDKGSFVECYPVQIYNDAEDCSLVQQFKIDSVEPTDFCK